MSWPEDTNRALITELLAGTKEKISEPKHIKRSDTERHDRLMIDGLDASAHMQTTNLLSIKTAAFLGCSKAHVQNLIRGRVSGLPALPYVPLGRRKMIRPASLEEWLEKALESAMVNTTPGIADRNTHIASRFKVPLSEVSRGGHLMQVGVDLNAADLIHCLCGVVAKIENHLL